MSDLFVKLLPFIPILILIGLILYGYFKLRKITRTFRNALPNEAQSIKGLGDLVKSAQSRNAETPKSLNNMEAIYMPMIGKDYPNLRVEELKAQAESLLYMSYKARESGDLSQIEETAGPYFLESLRKRLALNSETPAMKEVKVHDSAISRYARDHGQRIIDFQFAVEAKYKQAQGHLDKVQMRDTIRYQLIDDIRVYERDGGALELLTKNCPNCGAPLDGLRSTTCSYCSAAVEQVEVNAWLATSIKPEIW